MANPETDSMLDTDVPSSSPEGSRPLVLVADDDEINRFLCRESLVAAGFDVVEAADGSQALKLAHECHPDIVLMDVIMSPMDGFAACREIRSSARLHDVPLVMMTGNDDSGSVAMAYDAGATDFINKPISPILLNHRLRYVHRASLAFVELQANREELVRAQRMARLGAIMIDLRRRTARISREAALVLDRGKDELVLSLRALMRRLEADDYRRLMQEFARAVELRESLATEFRYRRPNGGILTLSLRGEAEFVGDEPVRVRIIVQDVSELKEAEARVRYLAHHDVLTGLPNRFSFNEKVVEALRPAGRRVRQGALHLIDLDRFKEVNDTLGHAVGDELLRQVAARLGNHLRGEDFIARLGGDEFAIIQANTSSEDHALVFANRLLEIFNEPFLLDGHRVTCGASIGIMLYPCGDMTGENLLSHADLALYSAKREGRRTARVFEASMDHDLRMRKQIEQDVRDGFDRHWFELYFQPQFCARTGGVTGAEALLRLRHPVRGMVGPASFVPVAEDVGLILPLGRWVIREACNRAARLRVNGAPLRVSVNLSPVQLKDGDLFTTILTALDRSGLPPECLEIEVTESMIMENPAHAAEVLGRIRELGVAVAMDDFGTGYSSFQQLRSFPMDRIKIDRAFITDIDTDREAEAIVRTILGLCETLGLNSTAEGVETEAQLAILRASSCEEIQGFLLSRPLDPATFLDFLERTNASAAAACNHVSLAVP
ncbi:MAG: EAL domain-containing protein [Geminicoccaceae bacterium]